MGRELKRVPLDFDAPLNKIWVGYTNPHYKKCPVCENGRTPAGERLKDLVHLLMLSGSDGMMGKNHPYFDHIGKFVYGFVLPPSEDMAELTAGLAGRKCSSPFGHDSIDKWSAVKKIKQAAGVSKTWGICLTCNGHAIDPANLKAYNRWRPKNPPKGKGYQLWETTSEGSPTSPVFKTLDALCEWCEHNATTFGSNKTTKEQWRSMLDADFVSHTEGNAIFI